MRLRFYGWITVSLLLTACGNQGAVMAPSDTALPPAETTDGTSSGGAQEAAGAEEQEGEGSAGDDAGATDDTHDTTPPPSGTLCELTPTQQALLAAVNSARAQARQCGGTAYGAAPALAWDCQLAQAAQTHAADMAGNNFFSHTGSDGSSVSERVTAAGYPWRTVGENIAAGYADVERVMAGWLDSPGHCANLMNPAFTEFGGAQVERSGSDYGRYWVQVFAAPR